MAGDRAFHDKRPPTGKPKAKSRAGPSEPRSQQASSSASPSRSRGDKRQKFAHDRPEPAFWQNRDFKSRDIVGTMSCHERYQGPSSPWKDKMDPRKPPRPGTPHRGARPGKYEAPQRSHRFSLDWPPDFATSNATRKQKKPLETPRPKKHDTSHGVQTA